MSLILVISSDRNLRRTDREEGSSVFSCSCFSNKSLLLWDTKDQLSYSFSWAENYWIHESSIHRQLFLD